MGSNYSASALDARDRIRSVNYELQVSLEKIYNDDIMDAIENDMTYDTQYSRLQELKTIILDGEDKIYDIFIGYYTTRQDYYRDMRQSEEHIWSQTLQEYVTDLLESFDYDSDVPDESEYFIRYINIPNMYDNICEKMTDICFDSEYTDTRTVKNIRTLLDSISMDVGAFVQTIEQAFLTSTSLFTVLRYYLMELQVITASIELIESIRSIYD